METPKLEAPLLLPGGPTLQQTYGKQNSIGKLFAVYVLYCIFWYALWFSLCIFLDLKFSDKGGELLLFGGLLDGTHPTVVQAYDVIWTTGVVGFWIAHVPLMIWVRTALDPILYEKILDLFALWILTQTTGLLINVAYKLGEAYNLDSKIIGLVFTVFVINSALGIIYQFMWVYYTTRIPFESVGTSKYYVGEILWWYGMAGTLAFLGCTLYTGVTLSAFDG